MKVAQENGKRLGESTSKAGGRTRARASSVLPTEAEAHTIKGGNNSIIWHVMTGQLFVLRRDHESFTSLPP